MNRQQVQDLIKSASANGRINGFDKSKEEKLYSLFTGAQSFFLDESNGVYESQVVEIQDGAVIRTRHLDNNCNPIHGSIGYWKFNTRS